MSPQCFSLARDASSEARWPGRSLALLLSCAATTMLSMRIAYLINNTMFLPPLAFSQVSSQFSVARFSSHLICQHLHHQQQPASQPASTSKWFPARDFSVHNSRHLLRHRRRCKCSHCVLILKDTISTSSLPWPSNFLAHHLLRWINFPGHCVNDRPWN